MNDSIASGALRPCRGSRFRRYSRTALKRGRLVGLWSVLPHQKSALESIRVVAEPASRWQLVQYLSVAAAEHNIIGLERGDQSGHHIKNVLPPHFLAESL